MSQLARRGLDDLRIEDAQIIFRNFEGREGKYNAEGDRNFCVLLKHDLAETLDRDGWNVKALRSREEGDPDQPYLQVSVGFKYKPPSLVLITHNGRQRIDDEDLVSLFDYVDIATADIVIRPYEWAVGGKNGIKAYLKSLFMVAEEDYFEHKYRHLPEIGSNGRPLEIESGRSDGPLEIEGFNSSVIEGEIVEH